MATILVVDDEPDALHLLRAWLSKHDYDVVTAATGEQAFNMAVNQLPNLILLDVMLPDIDGLTICKRLRATPATSHIPVILLTAYDPAVGRAEALMAGANDYITKPIILHELLDRLNVLLAHDRDYIHQGQRLLEETVHSALTVVPCNLSWLLSIDTGQQALVSRAVATSESDTATLRLIQHVDPPGRCELIPLDPADNVLAQVAVSGVAVFNMPLSTFRSRVRENIYRACESLDLYFVSILPVQIVGTPLGVLLIGSRAPRDVETARGQQIMATIARQAAMVMQNLTLLERLKEREAESTRERAFRQALLDTMSDGLLVYDANGTISFANRRIKRLTGRLEEPLEGLQIEDLFAETDRHRLAPSLYQPLPRETRSLELNLLHANGTTIPVLAVQAGQGVSATGDRDERVMVITDLSEQKAREQALANQTRRLSALNHATRVIASTLSLEKAFEAILSEASGLLQATVASVLLRIPETNKLVYRAVVGPYAERLTGCRVPEAGMLARAVVEGRVLVETDLGADGDSAHPVERLTGMTVRSTIVAPLLLDEQVVGVIELLDEQPGAFRPDDLDVLQGLASAAAIAIGNARLYAEARRHVREMGLLLEASEMASSTLTIEHVVESIGRQLMAALSTQWCLVSYWDRERDELRHLAEVAEIAWERGEQTYRLSDFPWLSEVVETGKASILHCDEEKLHDTAVAGLVLPPPSVVLLLPIMLDGELKGLAKLSHLADGGTFGEEELERGQAALVAWERSLDDPAGWAGAEPLGALAQALLDATDAARCAICAVDVAADRIDCLFETGKIISQLGHGPTIPLSDTGLRRVALLEGTPVAIRVGETERLSSRPPSFPGINSGWRMITPLIARGQAIGLVEVIDTNPERRFSKSDLSLAQAIGGVVGNALENARLYSALLRRAAQLEAAYNDLREMDLHKTEWMQNVSHELRTPLTSIIGYVDLLMEGDLGPVTQEQIDGLQIIIDKARQLARLFDDILTLQAIDGGEPLRLQLSSLVQLARYAIEDVQEVAERSGLEIVEEFDPNLPSIYVHPDYIRQMFDNLLKNAVKFSPGGGRITVRIEDRGVAVRVQVSDQGIGIPREEQEKIWWRFYQVDGSMTRQYGGTGLGLAVVKRIVEKHEGRVSVESEPGRGSTFTVVLPKLSPPEVPDARE